MIAERLPYNGSSPYGGRVHLRGTLRPDQIQRQWSLWGTPTI